jgi:hypothetical protein
MPRPVPLPLNLLTVNEYAALSGISLRGAWYRVYWGLITSVKMGTKTLVVADMPLEEGMGVPPDAVEEYRDIHGDPLLKWMSEKESFDDVDG